MFERKSMEQIVARMVAWARATTTSLTDFRVGSKTRTLFEAVALIIEDMYDKTYRSMRKFIEDNIYSVMGFDRLPATFASGTVVFSRVEMAEEPILIPGGTLVQTNPTTYQNSMNYRTVSDVTLLVGTSEVIAQVYCVEPGERGNTGANSVTVLPNPPQGIDAVTNPNAFTNGIEEETKSAQKVRFQSFIDATARGTLASIEYGAQTVALLDDEDAVVERVVTAKAFEDLPTRRGEVDLYVWNGVGAPSQALLDEVTKIVHGYYDESGNPVYGYKSGGTQLNLYPARVKDIRVKVEYTLEGWASEDTVRAEMEAEIDTFFGRLTLGSTAYHTPIEGSIFAIEGVKDARLYLSTDGGTTYSIANVTTARDQVVRVVKPITYTVI